MKLGSNVRGCEKGAYKGIGFQFKCIRRILPKLPRYLYKDTQDNFKAFLRKNSDVFAWSHKDMSGIDPNIIAYQLNIDPKHCFVKQKCRAFNLKRYKAIKTKVDKLLKVDVIRSVDYPTWLFNIVLVKKANGQWRVCVDFNDLKKACPKDCFPLPKIDQLVGATTGHQLLIFMDAFSKYNQIRMYPPDQEHTSFITNMRFYYYKVMPFDLKNV